MYCIQAMPLIHLAHSTSDLEGYAQRSKKSQAQASEDSNTNRVAIANGTAQSGAFALGQTAIRRNNAQKRAGDGQRHSTLYRLLHTATNHTEYRLFTSKFCKIHFSVSCMRKFHLISQFVFPLAFVLFCSAYFAIYSRRQHQHDLCLP